MHVLRSSIKAKIYTIKVIETCHDDDNVPDEESCASDCAASDGNAGKFGVDVPFLGEDFGFCVGDGGHVVTQGPLLDVHETGHVDGTQLILVFQELKLSGGELGGNDQVQILQKTQTENSPFLSNQSVVYRPEICTHAVKD